MSEKSQREGHPSDVNDDDLLVEKESGPGPLLKAEREKKGLSREQVSQVTRLRRHIIEAIENEEWDRLPQSVFVKGFIRSYASALGLDHTRLLELYELTAPVKTAIPKPIVGPKRSKKGFIVIPIILVGVIVLIAHLWSGSISTQRRMIQAKLKLPFTSTQMETPASVQEGPTVETPPAPKSEESKPSIPENRPQPLAALVKIAEDPMDEEMTDASSGQPHPAKDLLVLKGIVKARTWVRINIDDEEPKEYIFQPGSRPEWKAKEGFYILVGNAAGIDFDFNGKRIENLGSLGQVVSLKLPGDFNRKTNED